MRDFKRKSLSLIKKGGIGLVTALVLPFAVFAVTTIGTSITTGGNITPTSNNTSDFGAAGTAWRNIYASGTSYLSHAVSGGNNIYDLGSTTSSWRNVYASGTLYISTSLISSTNNTADLGAYGNAFGNMYASGTFRNQVLFNAGNLNASGTSYLSHVVAANNNAWDLGSGTSSWRNIYASGTIQLSTSLISSTNNTADLGAYGNAFGNMYASGTFRNQVLFNAGNLNASGTSYLSHVVPAAINTYDLGASSTPWRSISASTSIRLGRQAASTTLGLASNSAVTDKGQGTCIVLRAADGTLVYLSATSTQSASAPWTALVVSTESCE